MKKMIFLMLLSFLGITASMTAQVNIGSPDAPHEGAVLDLSKATGNSAGLLLPRVSLSDVSTWQIGGDSGTGIGMLVYNTNDAIAGGEGSGLYTWNGNSWSAVSSTGADCKTVIDSEGNSYLAARFGGAGCWMTENLRATQYADGTPLTINNNTASDMTLKYACYPNNNVANVANLGMLYSWAAATNGIYGDVVGDSGEDYIGQDRAQGICPDGWHLPSDFEWNQLEKIIATSEAGKYSTTGPLPWDDAWDSQWEARGAYSIKFKNGEMLDIDPVGTSNAPDAYGFDAKLPGWVVGGTANGWKRQIRFWTSSTTWYDRPGKEYLGIYRELRSNEQSPSVFRRKDASENVLISVRCKKN